MREYACCSDCLQDVMLWWQENRDHLVVPFEAGQTLN